MPKKVLFDLLRVAQLLAWKRRRGKGKEEEEEEEDSGAVMELIPEWMWSGGAPARCTK